MNKKLLKLFSIILMVMMVLSIGTCSFAADDEEEGTTSTIIKPEDIKPIAPTDTTITNVGGKIIGVLQTIGVVLSVIVLIVLGIKYMMGSAEEKAEYKKTMIPYLVGAMLIFAASVFAQAIYGLFSGFGA